MFLTESALSHEDVSISIPLFFSNNTVSRWLIWRVDRLKIFAEFEIRQKQIGL